MGVSRFGTVAACTAALGALLTGCGPRQEATVTAQPGEATPASASSAAPSPLRPIAGIQDVMASMIDPAADFLWESVSTTVTRGKVRRSKITAHPAT
jgi:hypothetical protein